MRFKTHKLFIYLAATLLLILPALANRTAVRAGWNLFTTQQDIEMGRQMAGAIESQSPIVTDKWSNGYITALGSQLASHAPGYRYPYQFKIVNDDAVNSFVLPGGFVYVTSGLIQAAPSEQQLAGLLAHQIAHVVLRHGSQEVSQAYTSQYPNAQAGRVPVSTALNRLNITSDSDSIMKNSSDEEEQADLLATQILFDSRFDPRQMTQFFQTLRNEPTYSTAVFFNNHPGPTNRAARVRREIQNLGGLPRDLRGDSPDLRTTQNRLRNASVSSPRDDDFDNDNEAPSTRMVTYRGRDVEFRYPENWRVSDDRDAITIAPDFGFVSGALAYGMTIATFEPQGSIFGQNLNRPSASVPATTLARATDQLVADLRRSNSSMRVTRTDQRRVDGEPALITELSNDSPVGGRETDWLVTVLRSDGLLHYFIGVAPQRESSQYQTAFDRMVSSVRFLN